jgi:hypothetical protein
MKKMHLFLVLLIVAMLCVAGVSIALIATGHVKEGVEVAEQGGAAMLAIMVFALFTL